LLHVSENQVKFKNFTKIKESYIEISKVGQEAPTEIEKNIS